MPKEITIAAREFMGCCTSPADLMRKPAALIFFAFLVFLLPVNGLSDCVEGDCQNGHGTRITADGGIFVGEFKDGLANGQGTLTYNTDDEKYEGEFKDNWKHGKGSLTYSDGYQYVGKWKDGKRHGYGVESYPGCDDKAGYWISDRFVGREKPEEFKTNPGM